MGHFFIVTTRLAGTLLGMLLASAPFIAVQAADDYLSILEAEASDTGDTAPAETSFQQTTAGSDKVEYVSADKVIAPGLSFEAFEETLSSRYSGSNFLYVKLTAGKRKGVYRFYQSDSRMSSIREEIVRLLSSS